MNHRFLVGELPAVGERLRLEDEEARHARVLRLRDGEPVEIFDGRGSSAAAIVRSQSRDAIELEVTGAVDAREPRLHVTLALALVQPEKFEFAIQKGTELGASRFVPLLTRFTEVRAERIGGKLDRWRRIAAEAAKQCGRSRIPEVSDPLTLEVVLGSGPCLLFDPSGGPLREPAAAKVTLLIGPEGGWDLSELELARSRGADLVLLGERRLRAETAAIVAVAAVIQPWR